MFKKSGFIQLLCCGVAVVMLTAALLVPVTVQAEGVKTVGRTRVAVLPWRVNAAGSMEFLSGAISEMLTSRLGSLKNVTVVRSDLLKKSLSGYTEKSDISAVAIGIGDKLKIDYVLYGSITILGESISMDAKLLDVKSKEVTTHFSTGHGLDSVVAMADTVTGLAGSVIVPSAVPASVATAKSVEVSPVAASAKSVTPSTDGNLTFSRASKVNGGEKFWKSPFLKGLYVAMTSADLDKDGVKELFLLKGSSITVAVKREGRLDIIKELRIGEDVQFVAIDSIDTNSDGVAEVYVSGVRESSARSFSIEYKDGKYVWALKGLRRLFRVFDKDGKSFLVGQGFREADGFYGTLGTYKAEGNGLVETGLFETGLPDNTDIYRFGLLSGNGEPLLAVLGSRGHLSIYKKAGPKGWRKEWKSSEYFGGTLNYIEVGDDYSDTSASVVPVESRFIYIDIDGNGSNELIIKTGTPGGFGRYTAVPRSYEDGAVLALAWDGGFLNELWRTKKVSGYVADFFIERGEQDGEGVTLWLLVAEGGGMMFGKPKSYVLSYRLAL